MTATHTHDLAVAYRIYPIVSRPALGLPFSEDKYRLSEVCLRSFKESLGPLRVKIWAILDGCPGQYNQLFRNYFADDDLVLVPCDSLGNRASFGRQIEILMRQENAPLVYFAEDDYFYLPNQFRLMVDFLNQNADTHFVSPYDHRDCYTVRLHHEPKWIRVCASHHWRTASSTCLTFLTRQQTLVRYERIFRSYVRGNDDCSLWLSLTKRRVFNPFALVGYVARREFYGRILLKAWWYGWQQILFGRSAGLWIPVPGIATHLDRHSLSPTIDWSRLMVESCAERQETYASLHSHR
jgi:hypothetical protein